MAYFDTTWYVNFGDGSTTGYWAVPKRPQNAAVAVGTLCRQFTTPAVGSERVFVCIVAGTTANVTDATWVLTRGAKTTDGTATWIECTGNTAVNGDAANTLNWTTVKASVGTPSLGMIIKRNNGASYQVITTAGATLGVTEPAFSDTPGVTATESTGVVWTCLGLVGNFTGGQAPHARLQNAIQTTWFLSGNTVYVGDNHTEVSSGIITISPASALMARIICHAASGPYPPTAHATGASISMTSANFIVIAPQGSFYFYGISFRLTNAAGALQLARATAVGQVQNWCYFDNCSFWVNNAAGGNVFVIGDSGVGTWNIVVFYNTTVKFGAAAGYIQLASCHFTWRNTGPILASGSAVPTVLIGTNSASGMVNTIVFEGLDLSQLTGSLFSSTPNVEIGSFLIKDCKLNATTTVTTPINSGMAVQLSHCDSGAASYKSSRHTYEGAETTETAIVRTGGYQDPTGQVQSRKIVTTANAEWLRPYAAQPMSTWNAVTGSNRTVTVYGIANSESLPNNDDIWLEVSHLVSGVFPVGSTVTTTKNKVWDSNAAVSSDGSVWTPVYATWDRIASALLISNNDLTATYVANASAYGSAYLSTGKRYLEFTHSMPGTGATSDAITLNTTISGINIQYQMSVTSGGGIRINGASSASVIGALVNGDVLCIAIDFDGLLVWMRRNSGNWNNNASANPATGVGGHTISAGSYRPQIFYSSGGTTRALTANFGQSTYTFTKPSGFGDWIAAQPFKLVATVIPGMPGFLIPQVKVAKASATYYIDPQVELATVPFVYATFNGETTADLTLSNGNLTARATTGASYLIGTRSTAVRSTGRYYFEMTFHATRVTNVVGILRSTATFAQMDSGVDSTVVYASGTILTGNAGNVYNSIGGFSANDVACFAVDLDSRKVWIRRNAGNWNGYGDGTANPVTGINGYNISPSFAFSPAIEMANFPAANDGWTANFGQSAFAQAVPSGFIAGWVT